MPSAARRRRTVQEDEEESKEERTQSTQRSRRRAPPSEDESEEEVEEDVVDEEMVDAEPDSQDQIVKKLVRYALACEYQRTSIKRVGITEKVIGKQRGNNFKRIFDSAQQQLRTKFGMEMVVLPAKEKITLKDKRAAQKTKGTSKPTASYILTTVLPSEYRIPEIMPPSILGSADEEAAYMGLCSVIVSLIALSPGGQIPDHKLVSHLKRFNSNQNTGLDTTAATLKKLVNQGYIFKVVDKSADEETIDWIVGPRGKVEIGNKGIQGLVREVYGDSAPDDLEKRMQRSLGMDVKKINKGNEEGDEDEAPENGDPGPSITRTTGRRRMAADED